jgi:hypothetical protein
MLQRFSNVPFVEHVGHAAGHARREVAAGLAEHHDGAAGHVFAAVVARAFDDADRAGVAHGEALARDAAEVASPSMAPYITVLPTMMTLPARCPSSSAA